MCVLETTLSGCARSSTPPSAGVCLWTAGQRIDPNTQSTFVWRTSDACTTVSAMTYTNWDRGQPDYSDYSGQRDSCMCFWTGRSYKWHDGSCSNTFCSVCELDIRQQ